MQATLTQKFIDIAVADIVRSGASKAPTYAEVARMMGVSAQSLSQARLGTRPVSLERLAQWVKIWAEGQIGYPSGVGAHLVPRTKLVLLVEGDLVSLLTEDELAARAGNHNGRA